MVLQVHYSLSILSKSIDGGFLLCRLKGVYEKDYSKRKEGTLCLIKEKEEKNLSDRQYLDTPRAPLI